MTGTASNAFFLSPRNPAATVDQRELDALAIRLRARPDVQAAIMRAGSAFTHAVPRESMSDEAWSVFPDYLDSYCFRSILMAANSDPNYPRVLQVYSPAAEWLGNHVPASRWGSENPDNIYRIVPVEYGGRYAIHGQVQPNPASNTSFVLVADTNTSVTIGLIELQDMDIAADGSFAITLDETPAHGRKNHIQLAHDAMYVFIRDSMGDWSQTPNALRVERLNPPLLPPRTEDELAARAGRIMQIGVAPAYYWSRLVLNQPMQAIKQPEDMGTIGGLRTQVSCSGWFTLADDEAVIITTDDLASSYFSIVLYEVWGRTLEYRDHQSSMNRAMMVADKDGRYTFVIALRDPGVHNWLDTVGMHEVSAGMRWQGISPHSNKVPRIETRTVKLAELPEALPDGVRMVSPADRVRQMDERAKAYDRRFAGS